MIETNRRSLLIGLSGLICAPAIVRASSLMKVKPHFTLMDSLTRDMNLLHQELSKPEIMWLPDTHGYSVGDLVQFTAPSHWNWAPELRTDGIWQVINHTGQRGTMLERATKLVIPESYPSVLTPLHTDRA